jgi:uncharacterized protein YjbI with pentapeptide repeats
VRADYESSFAVLSERVEIIGDPRPSVSTPPRHDDEEPHPSIFRLRLEDVSLTDLTLRGLYVGRSELKGVSFQNSDLQVSTFNWSDLVECEFSDADLAGADLRACRFVRCDFRGANLSRADLRLSAFDDCTFESATTVGTRLYRRPRLLGFVKTGADQTGVHLTDQQRRDAEWCADAPEPGGG